MLNPPNEFTDEEIVEIQKQLENKSFLSKLISKSNINTEDSCHVPRKTQEPSNTYRVTGFDLATKESKTVIAKFDLKQLKFTEVRELKTDCKYYSGEILMPCAVKDLAMDVNIINRGGDRHDRYYKR